MQTRSFAALLDWRLAALVGVATEAEGVAMIVVVAVTVAVALRVDADAVHPLTAKTVTELNTMMDQARGASATRKQMLFTNA